MRQQQQTPTDSRDAARRSKSQPIWDETTWRKMQKLNTNIHAHTYTCMLIGECTHLHRTNRQPQEEALRTWVQ